MFPRAPSTNGNWRCSLRVGIRILTADDTAHLTVACRRYGNRTLHDYLHLAVALRERNALFVDTHAVGFGGENTGRSTLGIFVGETHEAIGAAGRTLHVAAFGEAVGRIDHQFVKIVRRNVVRKRGNRLPC